MIPIRDTIRSETYPVVNSVLIAANVVIFLVTLSQGRANHTQFVYTYGLVPARYSLPQMAAYFSSFQQAIAFISFMFLHGGLLHLLGNMWSLYIFGDNVEDHLGHFRYLAFYLLCGILSGLSHLVLNWHSQVPTIGASGAIAGVMGAYAVLYPKAKVLTLVPIFFFLHFVELPAFIFLGIWFLFQFLSATGSSAQSAGIAWWAHIGGFIFGIGLLKVIELLPQFGADRKIRDLTHKHSTPRLQVIRPAQVGSDSNSYGVIDISQREALTGAHKLVNITQGMKRRTFMLNVPAGVSEGSKLRLRGMGNQTPAGVRGDLFLKVRIKD